MTVVFTVAAQRDVLEIDAWWREHRFALPDAFLDELSAALEMIAATPSIGGIYSRRPVVRRWMLPTTKHHVYYAVGDDVVVVKRVWSGLRRMPRMPRMQ
jgi:plasmid stabilization system protein ParE